MSLVVGTETNISDYTHSDYISIRDGIVVIWKEYGYLRHSTNIIRYAELKDESLELTHLFPQTHVKKIIEADFKHIEHLIETLSVHHRQARSINALGTALKYITGVPDADDLAQLQFKEGQLIEASNQHIVINTKLHKQIDDLTTALNKLISTTKKEAIDAVYLYEILLTRNRAMINVLNNIIISITLGKIGLINC